MADKNKIVENGKVKLLNIFTEGKDKKRNSSHRYVRSF